MERLRQFMVTLATTCLVACVDMAVADFGNAKLLTGNAVGPVRLGMSIREVESLGVPFSRGEILLEGDPHQQLVLKLSGEDKVVVVFDDAGRVFEVSTSSPGLATANGARVGMTLAELQKKFPRGETLLGLEEGGFFVLVTRDGGGAFSFDADAIGEDCLLGRGCNRDLSKERAVTYSIR